MAFVDVLKVGARVLMMVNILVALQIGLANAGPAQKLGFHGATSGPIESLDFPSDAEHFYKKYFRQSRPVILRNATHNWPAFSSWGNFTYLKQTFGQERFNVEFRKRFDTTFPVRKTLKLAQFLDEYQKKDVYLDSLFPKDSSMLGDILLPMPLSCKKYESSIDNLNLLISSGNTSSALHQDGYENFLSVLSGVKEVILYHNKFTRDFDADKYTLAAGVSDVDPENFDAEKFPKIKEMPFLFGTLNPGDLLYIPIYWWHQVRSYGDPNIAVGIWFRVFNFDDELQKREIDENEHVIKATETFLELLDKQPLEIKCKEDTTKNADFYLQNSITRSDICLNLNLLVK
eukprot:Seg1188.2 transcript_id=Seg1188.2/GoldUCD/mRNA.D3Y31 product="hypothetical protein" protein_id=Seg1188.2/GoldUCD/D3Y31